MESDALIVVDMQNDFCHPDGVLYAEGSESVLPQVNREIRKALSDGKPIFYTQDTHVPNDPEFETWGEHCVVGTWGHEFHEDLAGPKNLVVQKATYDTFHETGFHERLQTYGVESVTIVGTLANVCVQETASSAGLYGYDVEVVADAVGYIDEVHRERALAHVKFLIGEVS